jgi:hypothetical protein
MKHILTTLSLSLMLASLAACGFAPVHTSNIGSAYQGSNIIVPEIPGRSGHELRKALVEEFATGLPGIDTATLTVSLRERTGRLAIRPDEAAARTDYLVTGRYVLDTGDNAITGTVSADTSFNVPTSAFGDITAQTAATTQAMNVLAQRIVDDLKLKLTNPNPFEDPDRLKDIQNLEEDPFGLPDDVEQPERLGQ